MIIRLTAAEFPTFILSTHERRTKCFRWAAQATAFWAQAKVIERTDEVGAVDRGRFRQSWNVAAPSSGRRLARLSNKAPYAGYVEQGMPPGVVPSPIGFKISKAILMWTFRKIGPTVGATEPSDVWEIAHAIQGKLAHFGYAGRPILTDEAFEATLTAKTRENILKWMELSKARFM